MPCFTVGVTLCMNILVILSRPTVCLEQNDTLKYSNQSLIGTKSAQHVNSSSINGQFSNKTTTNNSTLVTPLQNRYEDVNVSTMTVQSTTEMTMFNDIQSSVSDSQSSVNKPEENITTEMTTFNDIQSSVSDSQSTMNKSEENITITKPTTAKDGASVTQPNGADLASPFTVSKAGGKPTTNDVQPSGLGISTTAKAFWQSGIEIAAKPAAEDGHFIIYLILGSLLLSMMYIMYHNKNKIISLCQKDGSRRTRWPNTSGYQRLDQNLSEVITSLKKKTNIKLN